MHHLERKKPGRVAAFKCEAQSLSVELWMLEAVSALAVCCHVPKHYSARKSDTEAKMLTAGSGSSGSSGVGERCTCVTGDRYSKGSPTLPGVGSLASLVGLQGLLPHCKGPGPFILIAVIPVCPPECFAGLK